MEDMKGGAKYRKETKERNPQYLYSAIYTTHKCSDIDRTVLPANYTMPAWFGVVRGH